MIFYPLLVSYLGVNRALPNESILSWSNLETSTGEAKINMTQKLEFESNSLPHYPYPV